jgi:hypothetical protein
MTRVIRSEALQIKKYKVEFPTNQMWKHETRKTKSITQNDLKKIN